MGLSYLGDYALEDRRPFLALGADRKMNACSFRPQFIICGKDKLSIR
jgi:hypothetical protein